MVRSFTDRILGGVLGGLAASLHVNVWGLRLLVFALTLITQGAFALVYLALWWTIPQESLIEDRPTGTLRLLLVLLIIVGAAGIWMGQLSGWLTTDSGQSLFWPLLLLLASTIFFMRQLGDAS